MRKTAVYHFSGFLTRAFVLTFLFLFSVLATAGEKAYPAPFWEGPRLEEDPILFTSIKGAVPEGKLLAVPVKILKVTNRDGSIVYKEGIDYQWVPGTRTVRLPKGSKIPFFTEEVLYPKKGSKWSIRGKVNSDRYLFCTGNVFLANHQIRFTYEHKDTEIPRPGKIYGKLPKTFAKIRAGKPIVFAVFGDSISCGANASKVQKFAPFQPMQYERFLAYLEKKTGKKVAWYNRSQGGRYTGWAIKNLEKRFANVPAPDFIFIAWGMNDITSKIPVTNYIKYTKMQMEMFRKRYPDVEFVIMSSMYANPEWSLTQIPMFEVYRKELQKLADDNGVLFVDQTKVWGELLKRKSFMSITGNGVNHPNDFGHKVYADIMIDAFERSMGQ